MNIQISFKHMEPTDWIKSYTEKRSEKLKKYFNGKVSVTWNFSVEKQKQIAHCHVVGDHMDYFTEVAESNLHASIDGAVEKIIRQLKKKKEILKESHPQKLSRISS